MPNYANGKIYKIVDNTSDMVYVGSTCEPTLARRLAGHVGNYKLYLKGNNKQRYITSFKIIANDDYDIILIENFSCNNKDELHARERHWTNRIDCVNKVKNQGLYKEIGQTVYRQQYNKEYCEKNKEPLQEIHHMYYEANKEVIQEKHMKYCQEHKEEIAQYKKQYAKDNKEYLKQQNKQHYEANKEKIRQRVSEKQDCECGACYTIQHKKRHEKSQKHQNYLLSVENNDN